MCEIVCHHGCARGQQSDRFTPEKWVDGGGGLLQGRKKRGRRAHVALHCASRVVHREKR